LLCAPFVAVLAGTRATSTAAESAALAAADTAVGIIPGSPCASAAHTAEANDATVVDCVVDGYIVTVAVTRKVGLSAVTARATAGPPMTIVRE
jgi:hypothetical protein